MANLQLVANNSAIVTGSSSGIGRSIALQLAENGAKLIVCVDLRPEPATTDDPDDESSNVIMTATHELICTQKGPGRAIFLPCDVSVESSTANDDLKGSILLGVKEMVEEAYKVAGRLDILVNCAGIGIFAIPIHKTSLDIWNKCMAINSTGPFLTTKHVIARLLDQSLDIHGFRGSIVNISSIAATVGLRECGAYCASKAAIEGLTRAVAIDHAKDGIRCNAVSPGYIPTSMIQPYLDSEVGFKEYLHTAIPMQRLGRPIDVAGAVMWLASSQLSGYVTGIVLPVDGGFKAR